MPAVDFSTWPMWVLLLLVLVNTFKDQIGAFVPTAIRDHFGHKAKRSADREEFEQELRQLLLDNLVQGDAAEQLRMSRREEQLLDIIKAKDNWLQQTLDVRLKAMEENTDQLVNELASVKHGIKRTNDILTTIHIALSKLTERVDAS